MLTRIFHLYRILPIIIWSVGLAIIWLYPLTRERAGTIRTELEQRRGKLRYGHWDHQLSSRPSASATISANKWLKLPRQSRPDTQRDGLSAPST